MTYLSVFNLANTTLLASPCFLGMVDFKQMELCHLRYFVAVAETLKFTKAAERLRVAHPALSRQAWTSCVAVRAWANFTAGRNLFPKKVRELLKHAGESVQKCARWLATSRASCMWATCMSAGKRLPTSHSPARWKRSGWASAAPQWET